MSASDFSGRLFEPVMARPRRPLSSSASTDSCNIRFSLRTMISGALSSSRRLRRLFLLITRRYRSLRSEVAKRPPSNGTNGRRSGGRTGRASRTIHSGLLPEPWNASKSLRRLENFLILVSDFVLGISSRISAISSSRIISLSRAWIASAPMVAENSSPNSSRDSKYSSSVSS